MATIAPAERTCLGTPARRLDLAEAARVPALGAAWAAVAALRTEVLVDQEPRMSMGTRDPMAGRYLGTPGRHLRAHHQAVKRQEQVAALRTEVLVDQEPRMSMGTRDPMAGRYLGTPGRHLLDALILRAHHPAPQLVQRQEQVVKVGYTKIMPTTGNMTAWGNL